LFDLGFLDLIIVRAIQEFAEHKLRENNSGEK
jgi:hypothetical protein